MATRRVVRAKAKADTSVVEGESFDGSALSLEVSGRSSAEVIDRARKSLMDAVLDSVKALADGAKDGSLAHIKLLLQLVGLDEGELAPVVVEPRKKSFADSIFEAWVRESETDVADGDSNTGGLRGNGR